MPQPLIGITGRRWPARRLGDHVVPALDGAEVDLYFTEYGAAIAACGGLPVLLTRDAEVAGMVGRLDGLVLTGGADVDPAYYGQEPDPALGATEPDRDRWELTLLRGALAQRLPVLAVCRGAQLANVALGGTLHQHVGPDEGDGHPRFADPRTLRCHTVALDPGTVGERLYGAVTEVNSLHHQTLDRLGEGLVVSGRSPDGTAEVIELPGVPFLGVQWHPEALADPREPAFGWLVECAAARLAHG